MNGHEAKDPQSILRMSLAWLKQQAKQAVFHVFGFVAILGLCVWRSCSYCTDGLVAKTRKIESHSQRRITWGAQAISFGQSVTFDQK